MQCRIADLRCKEVVNIYDGQRLGFVEDVLVDTRSGSVMAIVVPGPCRVLGLFFPGDDYIIHWESILRIGEDLILIDVKGEHQRTRRRKRRLL